MLKKWLSYFLPINVAAEKSEWSKNLEISWNNGQLVLDSANTNYSYGSLQRILKIGLQKIGFNRIVDMQHILVLGVAGGSVIKTLINEVGYQQNITGVEIDEKVIALAEKYFGLATIKKFELVHEDAQVFCSKTKKQYDLIIIDIFQDSNMPSFLFESSFVKNVLNLLQPGGFILFNTMCLVAQDEKRKTDYLALFDKKKVNITVLSKVEFYNELIIVELRDNTATY